MMCAWPAPSERAASTNSRSRSDSVCPRTIRPMYGQFRNPMTRTMSSVRGIWSATATSAMANSSCWNARMTSIVRLDVWSAQPPKYPAVTPTTVPTPTATNVASVATTSEIRAPSTMRLKTSRPVPGSTPQPELAADPAEAVLRDAAEFGVERLLVELVGPVPVQRGEQGGGDRDQDEQADDRRARHRGLVAPQPQPRDLARGAALDRPRRLERGRRLRDGRGGRGLDGDGVRHGVFG